MREYSYFRAEGKSLLTVQTIIDARAELAGFKDQLRQKYNASVFYIQENGAPEFAYLPEEVIPKGWIQREQIGRDYETGGEKTVWVIATPKPGSADAGYIYSVMALMQRARDRSRVGEMFGFPHLLEKQRAGGRYHAAFVREGDLEAGNKAGYIRDETRTIAYSSHGCTVTGCPIDFQQFEGDWYIRVWNDADGKPVVTPPDAVLMPFEDMLDIDGRENTLRFLSATAKPVVRRPFGGP